MSNIQLYSNEEFSVRTTKDEDGTVWFVAKDIAQALEYSENSINQVNNLFACVPDVWTAHKRIMVSSENGIVQSREMLCLTEQGVYFFLGRSDKPKALPYQMWIAGDVVPDIMHKGSYSAKTPVEDRELKLKELEIRQRELDMQAAQVVKDMLNNPPFPLTDETRTVFGHEVFRLATNRECLAMLPESTEQWYTATQIGEILGISANKVGRIAKEYGIKAPEGESNEYGRWVFTKSKYSNHECSSFIYNARALEWFKGFQNGEVLGA